MRATSVRASSDAAVGSPNYDHDAEYIEDTRQYSVMSYFSETNTGADFKGYSGAAPMMDDIAALQRLYGADTTAFNGDTTYGFNGNTGRNWYTASAAAAHRMYRRGRLVRRARLKTRWLAAVTTARVR